MASNDFTHFDSQGNARMVDVSAKEVTVRVAVAKGSIEMTEETFNKAREGETAKGDVLGVARIAGIMAAKRCADLIPLCHPLIFDTCTINFEFPAPDAENKSGHAARPCTRRIEAICSVKLSGKTGAEMEALTGVSVALLTIYDMCKALDRGMVIGDIRLWEKSGGKSGHYKRDVAGHD
jgi:cyclic pyranopterin phosphate synthase